MNTKWKSYVLHLAMVTILTLAVSFQSLAANARISFSDPSAEVGSEFTVRMKFTCSSGEALGNTDVMLAYDANMLEFVAEGNASGGSGAIRVTSGVTDASEVVTTLKFKALRAGNSQITITSWEGYDADGQTLTMDHEGSSAVTITAPANFSSDASLQSLQVSPGTLNPAFSPDVENYTVTVGLDTTDIRVSAVPTHEKAQSSLQGETQLQEGENTVVCAVTAEDGTTVRNYTITVNKVEGGESVTTAQDGATDAPTTSTLEVLATLEASKVPFKLRIAALPDDMQPAIGLRKTSFTIGDTQVEGWAPPTTEGGSPEYCIFYGISENNVEGFYCYDIVDHTIQKYFADTQDNIDKEYHAIAERYDSLVDDYKLAKGVAIGGIVAAIVLLIALLIALFGRRKNTFDDEDDDEQDEALPKEKKAVKAVRGMKDKKLSKEERYMLGVEDEYSEEEESVEEAPEEIAESEEDIVEKTIPVEQEIEKHLAAAAVSAKESVKDIEQEDEEDDFEIFDLDDNK